MANKELVELRQIKNETCVSIIVPTHRVSPERQNDNLEVRKAIAKAKEILHDKCPPETEKQLNQKLDDVYHRINFLHNQEGLGLFVSAGVSKLVRFPFPVTKAVVVNQSFAIRDLIRLDNYEIEYFLLEISEKSARLFRGSIDELAEIQDPNFPKAHTAGYEYARPTRGSSYVGNAFVKGFEKDKSIVEEIRMEEFLNEVDKLLKWYLSSGSLLLIAGTEKDIALFKHVSRHVKNIIGTIRGNASYIDAHQLGKIAWLKQWSYLNQNISNLVKIYEEKIGAGLGVEGVKNVWGAAKAGRGLTLLVERDFAVTAFVDNADNSLHLEAPGTGFTIADDAIEDIIQTVLDKGGDVKILENGDLKTHHHIALITRY